MTTITSTITSPAEIVISERVVSTEFRVTEIEESVSQRYVRVTVELGPFVPNPGPEGGTVGTSRRGFTVWSNDEYDAVRDTWANADLIARIQALFAAQ